MLLLAFALMVGGIVLMVLLDNAVFLALTVAGFVLVIVSVPGLSRGDGEAGQPAPTSFPTTEQPTMVQAPAEAGTTDEEATTRIESTAAPQDTHAPLDEYDPAGPEPDEDAAPAGQEREVTDLPPAPAMREPAEEDAGEIVAAPHSPAPAAFAAGEPVTTSTRATSSPSSSSPTGVEREPSFIRGLPERAAQRPAGALAAGGAVAGAVLGLFVWIRRIRS